MALSPERYTAVDAELQRIQHFLALLAAEIEAAAPLTDKRGFSWMAAIQADGAIAQVQHRLKDDHEKQRLHEKLRGRRGKPT